MNPDDLDEELEREIEHYKRTGEIPKPGQLAPPLAEKQPKAKQPKRKPRAHNRGGGRTKWKIDQYWIIVLGEQFGIAKCPNKGAVKANALLMFGMDIDLSAIVAYRIRDLPHRWVFGEIVEDTE